MRSNPLFVNIHGRNVKTDADTSSCFTNGSKSMTHDMRIWVAVKTRGLGYVHPVSDDVFEEVRHILCTIQNTFIRLRNYISGSEKWGTFAYKFLSDAPGDLFIWPGWKKERGPNLIFRWFSHNYKMYTVRHSCPVYQFH